MKARRFKFLRMSGLRTNTDASVRIVANYETSVAGDGRVSGVKLYALLQTISPLPLTAGEFEGGVKTEPSEIRSIWLEYDYQNVVLEVKQQGKHLFHFVEDGVSIDEDSGRQSAVDFISRWSSDVQDYGKRAYLSVPLKQYMTEGVGVDVYFSIYTYSDSFKTYVLDETGASCRGDFIHYIYR